MELLPSPLTAAAAKLVTSNGIVDVSSAGMRQNVLTQAQPPPTQRRPGHRRQRRLRRHLGSVRVRDQERAPPQTTPPAPPSLVALVILDILAGIFTLHAVAALLFMAS